MTYPYRVFISYAHADRSLVEALDAILAASNLVPLWDKDITPGNPFTQEIKDLIARAHIFMPLITENSYTRPWVHQETGFAIALDIPILPLSVDAAPSEMISQVQAISVDGDLSDLADQLTQIDLEKLVVPKPNRPLGTFYVADLPEDRTESMIRYANWVMEIGEYAPLRLQARYSVFAIPDEAIDHPLWSQREGDARRSDHLRSLQRGERQILERHARMAGCRLIIDPTASTLSEQGSMAQAARQRALLDFLKGMPPEKVEVVMSTTRAGYESGHSGRSFFGGIQGARVRGAWFIPFSTPIRRAFCDAFGSTTASLVNSSRRIALRWIRPSASCPTSSVMPERSGSQLTSIRYNRRAGWMSPGGLPGLQNR